MAVNNNSRLANFAPVRAGRKYQDIRKFRSQAEQDKLDKSSELMADIARGPINLYGDIMAQTLGRIAENMVNPEAAERGRQKSAIRKEAQKMFDKVPGQMTADDIRFYEQRTGNKYEQLTFEEGINSGLNFILEDAIKGSQEIQEGKKFTELSGTKQLGVGILPLEFWLGGAGGRKAVQKVGGEVLDKYKDMPLGELVANSQARQEIPEVIADIENQFPVLMTRQEATKEKLEKAIIAANQSGKKYKQKIDLYDEIGISKDEGKRLVMKFPEIRKATNELINKKEISNSEIVNEFFKKQDPNKKFSIQQIADETGLSYAQVNKVKEYNRKDISDKFVAVKPGIARREEMREFLDTLPEGTFITSQDLRDMFKSTKTSDGTITNDVGAFLQSNPSYRKKVKLDKTFDFGFDRGFETVPDFLKNYMDTFMNDGRFHFKNEITNVDFNGNRIDGGQLSRFFTANKDYKKYFASTEFKGEGKKAVIPTVLSENREKLGYQIGSGPRRAEYVFLYDYLRSVNPNLFPNFKGNKKELYQALVDDLVEKNYKELYKNDIATIRNLDKLREQGTERIKDLFDMYSTEFPQQFQNLDKGDFVLHLSHNFPLQLMRDDFGFAGSLKGSTSLSLARTNIEHHRKIEDEIAEIVSEVNRKYVNKEVGPQLRQKIPPEINKRLVELDKKANKLGTVVYFKFGQQQFKVGNEIPPSVDDLVNATEKYFQYVAKQSPGYRPTKTDKNFGDVEIPVKTSKTKDFTGPKFDVDPITKARGGEIRGYAEGDQVMAEENQEPRTTDQASMLSKIGNLFIPSAEAAPFKQVFKPIMDWMMVGDAPKTITNIQKSQQKALPAPKLPFKRETETRYNIISPEGQKVFQSPGLDDANQKALELGNQEGLTFRVEEVQVPVKVKKKKTGTQLAVTLTPDAAIGTGSNRVYYSRLVQNINSPTGNLIIKGQPVARDSIALSAKEWQDYFRSIGVRESELQDAYIRQYLNKKGGFNKETRQFTNETPITYDEIADLVASSPSNSIQSAKYGDYAGNLKYGDSGRNDNYVAGTREERVLWIDSADIRGDIGGLPSDIARYEGHSSMRQVTDDVDFATKNKLGPNSEPYVIGWSLNSTRKGKSAAGANVFVSVADEIQSDFLQKAASVKAKLKKDVRAYAERGDLEEVKNIQTRLDNVFRPLPATAFEINEQLTNLNKAKEVFDNVAKVEIDRVTPGMFQALKAAGKLRDESLREINRVIDNVDMNKMFPNIPFKDQKDWVDALIKNDVYEAAKKRFYFDENGAIQINRDAPSHYAVAPAKAVRAADPTRGIKLDPTDPNRSGKAVAYDMQYGGPKAVDHTGAHFTSNSEESLRRIARSKNSDVSIGTIDFGNSGSEVETYLLELTPDMLTPYATYFKDGGIVQKKKMFNPVLSINDILRPIGA